MNHIIASIAVVSLLAPSLGAQCETIVVSMPYDGHSFNQTLERVGDVNGDGVADVAVGHPATGAGSIQIFSGRTGTVLLTIPAPAGAAKFGATIANVGDLNGDGKADLAASTPDTVGFPNGAVFVYSLASPGAPFLITADSTVQGFGRHLAAAGDVDQDGKPDILVAVKSAMTSGAEVQIRSGANGVLIRSLPSNWVPESLSSDFGRGLVGGSDLDGDSVPDVVVGDPLYLMPGSGSLWRGRVMIYSGATGALLRVTFGTNEASEYGASVDFLPDFDQDGVAEILVGASTSASASTADEGGLVRIESGATGAVLREHPALSRRDKLGYRVRSLGDIDGDGVGDYGAVATAYSSGSTSIALAWSGMTGLEIVAIASSVLNPNAGPHEYFFDIAPLADVDGDGHPEIAVLSSDHMGMPTTAHLRFMRASHGTLHQAALVDGCWPNFPAGKRPALVVSGCLESNGSITIDYNGFGGLAGGFLFASLTTGNTLLPDGCALTVGLPAIIVPIPGVGEMAFTAPLPAIVGPLALHLQFVIQQQSSVITTSGRSTIMFP